MDFGLKDGMLTVNVKCPNCGKLQVRKKQIVSEWSPITIEDLFCSQDCKSNFSRKS